MAATPPDAADQRVSDADREAATVRLRAAYETGRIDVAELERRLDAGWASRTRADLAAVGADLPPAASRPPDPAPRAAAHRKPRANRHRARRDAVAVYLVAMLAMTVVWLATGAGYPWPIWPALGWGFALLQHHPARGRAFGPCVRSPRRRA